MQYPIHIPPNITKRMDGDPFRPIFAKEKLESKEKTKPHWVHLGPNLGPGLAIWARPRIYIHCNKIQNSSTVLLLYEQPIFHPKQRHWSKNNLLDSNKKRCNLWRNNEKRIHSVRTCLHGQFRTGPTWYILTKLGCFGSRTISFARFRNFVSRSSKTMLKHNGHNLI